MTEFFSGDDVSIDTIVKDESGNVIDISGASLLFVISRKTKSLAAKTKSATINDAPAGDASIILTDTETALLLGDYVYQLEITDASGNKEIVSDGNLTIKRRIPTS